MPVPVAMEISELRTRLERWAEAKVPGGGRVTDVAVPPSNGMLAPTVLFDLESVTEVGAGTVGRFVLRGETDSEKVPEFDVWPVDMQFRLLEALAGKLPVPTVRWFEHDPSWIGVPFFVMDRAEGVPAPDNMPYVFDGWVTELKAEERAAVQDALLGVLASVHAVDVGALGVALGSDADSMRVSASSSLARVQQRYDWARVDRSSPLIEELIHWCGDHLPEQESDPVLCWGDARAGNLLYRGTRAGTILDWDMASIGPRELDVAWAIVHHAMFQDIAATYEIPGLPDMFVRSDVIAAYEARSGVTLRDLEFYEAIAALRLATAALRGHHIELYGIDTTVPLDDLIPHAALLTRMIDGSYWDTGPSHDAP